MPSFKNVTADDESCQVRKWLSDSSVKYNAESGLYEKNFTQIVLDRYNLPRMNILLQCLIDCLVGSTAQMLIEESIPIFIWIIDRFKSGKHNEDLSMINIMEMTFLICDKLHCRCTEPSNVNYQHFNTARKRIFQQIGMITIYIYSIYTVNFSFFALLGIKFFNLDTLLEEDENAMLEAFEVMLNDRSTKDLLQTFHKILETCQSADPRPPLETDLSQFKFQTFLVQKFFRRIIEKIGLEMKFVLQNPDLMKQARSLVHFVRNRNQNIFNKTIFCVLYDGKKQKEAYLQVTCLFSYC